MLDWKDPKKEEECLLGEEEAMCKSPQQKVDHMDLPTEENEYESSTWGRMVWMKMAGVLYSISTRRRVFRERDLGEYGRYVL